MDEHAKPKVNKLLLKRCKRQLIFYQGVLGASRYCILAGNDNENIKKQLLFMYQSYKNSEKVFV